MERDSSRKAGHEPFWPFSRRKAQSSPKQDGHQEAVRDDRPVAKAKNFEPVYVWEQGSQPRSDSEASSANGNSQYVRAGKIEHVAHPVSSVGVRLSPARGEAENPHRNLLSFGAPPFSIAHERIQFPKRVSFLCVYVNTGRGNFEEGQRFALRYVRLKARSNSPELSCSIVGRP